MDLSDSALYNIDIHENLKAFVKNEVRFDGRRLMSHRGFQSKQGVLSSPNVCGSSRVQLGGTSVICGINVMVGNPSISAPDKGDIGI
jgi:exosome complex RNA-binding protein Rrp42 (RNase PH superfamily)